MSASEKYFKEVFDEIKMPESLKEATLDTIEKKALACNDPGFFNENTSHYTVDNEQPAQEVDIKKTTSPSSASTRRVINPFKRRVGFALAACMLLCLVGFGGFSAFAMETAVVGIEMNPSIELGINRFDVVVDARALNEDGEQVLGDVSVVGKSYDEALAAITQSEAFQSFIAEDSFIDVFVICDNDNQSSTLVNQGQKSIGALSCDGVSNRVLAQTRDRAEENGMGVGRYGAAQALIALDPSLTIEDCKSMSMKDMRTRITDLDPDSVYARSQGNQGNKGSADSQKDTSQGNQGSDTQNGQGNQGAGSGNGQNQQEDVGSGNGQGAQGNQDTQGDQGSGSGGSGQGGQEKQGSGIGAGSGQGQQEQTSNSGDGGQGQQKGSQGKKSTN